MSTDKNFIKRQPVFMYYILVFAISWGGILTVVGSRGYPGAAQDIEKLSLFVMLALFAGPSVSGILMTGLVHGWAGVHDLIAWLLHWRVSARWYTIACLFAPLLVTAIFLILLLFGIAWGLIGGGLLEELGWTGFAVPELRRRYSVFATGLIVGILWGVWHFLVTFWMSGTASGELSLSIFLPALLFYVVSLPAYRVLLVWFYDRTGSLLLVMLMHAAFSSSRMILNPAGLALLPGLAYEILLAVVLWVIVAAVMRKDTLPQQVPGALPG